MDVQPEILSVCFLNKTINGVLRCFSHQEEQYFRVAIPSLKLSAYGYDLENASALLSERLIGSVFQNYFTYGPEFVASQFAELCWTPHESQPEKLAGDAEVCRITCVYDQVISGNSGPESRAISVSNMLVRFVV